jgi:hypothetical protein
MACGMYIIQRISLQGFIGNVTFEHYLHEVRIIIFKGV